MNWKYLILLWSALLISGVWAKKEKEKENELAKLKLELESLARVKTEKVEALEKAERQRWEQRYRQSAAVRQHEDRSRSLENVYTRLANDISRKQDELIRTGNETREMKSSWEEIQGRKEVFYNLLSQSIEREAERLSHDIPLEISQRSLMLNSLQEKMNTAKRNISDVLNGFFEFRQHRNDLTCRQELTSRQSLIENEEQPVWRLQLGTVVVAEVDKTRNEKAQLLLRTGKLQGKVFAWRSRLAEDNNARIVSAVLDAAAGKKNINMTLDVLQTKSLGSGFTGKGTTSAWGAVMVWFKKGGLVMYPLILAAILGLLLSLERIIVLSRKSTNPERFMRKLRPCFEKGQCEEAIAFCSRSATTLGQVLSGILRQNGKSRDSAEKAARETMLRELPVLEKRMVLIAAIGGSAPLMGLLGTVSGMISLFKVITDVGTNDPRILAGGISEALVTTQTGLIIAIPILLLHGYLSDRLERIQNYITANSMEVLNTLWPEGK
jgi:biopolymer transport protein ExbB